MSDVAVAADELARVVDEAEQLVPEHDQLFAAMVAPSEPQSRPPWNAAAAEIVLVVHEGIRRLELALLAEITPDRSYADARRGGSTSNTFSAMESVVRLCEAVPRGRRDEVARLLDRWAAAAKRLPALDELARWTLLRRDNGKLPPKCPYCEMYSLRLAETSGVVACFTPRCKDDKGDSPIGRLDYHKVTRQPVLAWNDGRVQYPP